MESMIRENGKSDDSEFKRLVRDDNMEIGVFIEFHGDLQNGGLEEHMHQINLENRELRVDLESEDLLEAGIIWDDEIPF